MTAATTILIWLLVSVGADYTSGQKATNVVERFADVKECTRVRDAIIKGMEARPRLICVQAEVLYNPGT